MARTKDLCRRGSPNGKRLQKEFELHKSTVAQSMYKLKNSAPLVSSPGAVDQQRSHQEQVSDRLGITGHTRGMSRKLKASLAVAVFRVHEFTIGRTLNNKSVTCKEMKISSCVQCVTVN